MASSDILHVPATAGAVRPGWTWRRLDAACVGIFDCPHSTPTITESGPLMVRTQDVRGGVFRTDQAAHVSEETYRERTARVEPRPGDLLYSREGTYFGDAAEVPTGVRVCLGQRMVLVRPDAAQVSTRFLRYWLNSPILKGHIDGHRDGTVAERLNLPTIRGLPVLLPPVPVQQAIAQVLGALDNKIELNRRMDETLEAMARGLFKSWFVDFDAVYAKAEGRAPAGMDAATAALFPSEFEKSDLGSVPRGWTPATFRDVCDEITSGGTPSTTLPEYWNGGIPWFSSGETRAPFVVATEKTITQRGVNESSTRLAHAEATVVAGAGQGKTRGQSSLLLLDAYVNQSVVAMTAHRGKVSALWLFFDVSRRYEQFRALSDSHSSRGSLTTALLASVKTVCPSLPLVSSFDRVAGPLVERIRANLLEMRTLAEMRDLLLPGLLSGELRIRDAEKAVERVA